MLFYWLLPTDIYWLKWALFALAIFLYGAALFSIIPLVKEYENKQKNTQNIIQMYIGSVILFAGAYASAAVVAPNGEFICGIINYCGNHASSDILTAEDKLHQLTSLLFNSFYLSVTNLATLGPTGIEVRGWARIIVICQVAYTFYLTGVALSAAASRELVDLIKIELAKINGGQPDLERSELFRYSHLSFKKRLRLAWRILRGKV